jgi:hypothetical protein
MANFLLVSTTPMTNLPPVYDTVGNFATGIAGVVAAGGE